jgi:hypothetical protein
MSKNNKACGCWESGLTAPQTGDWIVTDWEWCAAHAPHDEHQLNRCLYREDGTRCGVYTYGDYCRDHAYRLIWDV